LRIFAYRARKFAAFCVSGEISPFYSANIEDIVPEWRLGLGDRVTELQHFALNIA
jgi:hypothetical protein